VLHSFKLGNSCKKALKKGLFRAHEKGLVHSTMSSLISQKLIASARFSTVHTSIRAE